MLQLWKRNFPLIIFCHIFVHCLRSHEDLQHILFVVFTTPSLGVSSFTPLISAGTSIKSARIMLDSY